MNDLRLTLTRLSSDTDSTVGTLHMTRLDSDQLKFSCFTLEDEKRMVKVFGETRIPEGTYDIKLRTEGGMHKRYSTKFGSDWHRGMLWLQDVPNFTWIYIHPGTSDDHTDGCILVGDGVMQNVTRAGQLLDPLNAYQRIYPIIASTLLAGKRVQIEVIEYA